MPLQTSALNAAAAGVAGIAAFGSLHTADPGGTGANEVTGGGYARVPLVWDPATGGVSALDSALAFSGPASSPATYFGVWSALSGGTFHGAVALTGDQAFNASGDYIVAAATITATPA